MNNPPHDCHCRTEPALEEHVKFLADDALEGRGTPSQGLEVAAAYLASQLRLYGWAPFDGHYQRYH